MRWKFCAYTAPFVGVVVAGALALAQTDLPFGPPSLETAGKYDVDGEALLQHERVLTDAEYFVRKIEELEGEEQVHKILDLPIMLGAGELGIMQGLGIDVGIDLKNRLLKQSIDGDKKSAADQFLASVGSPIATQRAGLDNFWFSNRHPGAPIPMDLYGKAVDTLAEKDANLARRYQAVITAEILDLLMKDLGDTSMLGLNTAAKVAEHEQRLVKVEGLTKHLQVNQQRQNAKLKALGEIVKGQITDLLNLQQTVTAHEARIAVNERNIALNRAAIEQNSNDISFMKEILLGRMTPSEQRQALREQWFPNMSPEQRTKFDLKLKMLEREERFIKTANEVLTDAHAAIVIANRLGVDKDVVKAGHALAAMGSVGLATYQAFQTGGISAYLQLGGMVAGLGGGGDSAQILAALEEIKKAVEDGKRITVAEISGLSTRLEQVTRQLADGQYQIRLEIRDLQQIQHEMLDQLGTITEQLSKLDQTSRRQQGELIQVLSNLQDSIFVNRELIQYAAVSDLIAANEFIQKRHLGFKFLGNSFANYEEQQRFFRSNFAAQDFERSYVALQRLLSKSPFDQSFHPSLFAVSAQRFDALESQDDYVRKVYRPVYEYFRSDAGRRPERFVSLVYPSQSLRDIHGKQATCIAYKDVFRYPTETGYQTALPEEDLDRAMRTLLNPTFVATVADIVRQLAPYFELVADDGRRLMTPEELKARREFNKTGLRFLKQALHLLNIAIAQQTLLSGDYLIREIGQDFAVGMSLQKVQDLQQEIAAINHQLDRSAEHTETLDRELQSAENEAKAMADALVSTDQRVKEAQSKLAESLEEYKRSLVKRFSRNAIAPDAPEVQKRVKEELERPEPVYLTKLREAAAYWETMRESAQRRHDVHSDRTDHARKRLNLWIKHLHGAQSKADELALLERALQTAIGQSRAELDGPGSDAVLARRQNHVRYQRFIRVLQHNPILSRNFMVYYIGNVLDRKQVSLINYHIALHNEDVSWLQKCIDVPFEFKWTKPEESSVTRPQGWSVMLAPEVYIALPNATEVAGQRMQHPEHLEALVATRKAVITAILTFEIPAAAARIADPQKRMAVQAELRRRYR